LPLSAHAAATPEKIQSIIVPPNGLLTSGRERIVELFLTVPPALLSRAGVAIE
jgi:hypothetical protein